MKGVIVTRAGAPYEVTSDLEKPTPGPNQVLVKSIFSGINPVETFMQSSGVLVTAWPIVLGCDASGIVVEVGEGTKKFKKGDAVFGCTKLGTPGYGTFQEYFLMDEHLAFRKPDNVSLDQAATIGVGALTASLGLVAGLGLRLPDQGENPNFNTWVIILGGSGSVGQSAVQIAKRCGYKVLASCSSVNEALVKSVGADATIDYKSDLSAQVSQVEAITGGNFSGVLDTTASSALAALEFLTKGSKSGRKKFASTDDWSNIEAPASISIYRITLGMVGRSGQAEEIVSKNVTGYIPYLEHYLEEGSLKPQGLEIVGTGFDAVSEAIKASNAGRKGGRKCVVKLQDP